MKKILLINGPNLQLLGTRNPEVYGTTTLDALEKGVKKQARKFSIELTAYQSNIEGELVNEIGSAKERGFEGIIINPGAYTHTSIAIRDAIESVGLPTIEVHISNIHARESFRHISLTAPVCLGQIVGLGLEGYTLALQVLASKIKNKITNQTTTKKN